MLSNACSQELHKWLTATFNDFYSVWSPNDCNQYIVHHEPGDKNEAFDKMLQKLYPDFSLVQETGFGIFGEEMFRIHFDNLVIEIEPMDNKIYHTKYI